MQVRDSVDAGARATVLAHSASMSTWGVLCALPRTRVYSEQVSVGYAYK